MKRAGKTLLRFIRSASRAENVDNRWRVPSMQAKALPMPVHVEFTLHYLIQRAGAAVSPAVERLDQFESLIARLARSWRPARPLAPARELRMTDDTRERLLAWFEANEGGQGHTIERLGVYASGAVTDDSVPEGWVRLRLDSPTRAN